MISPIVSLEGYTPVAVAGRYFFFFLSYSFLGWVLEGSYNKYSNGNFRKEGFLKGPFKPMYGFAPLLLLIGMEIGLPVLLLLLLALIVPSGVEYASGWLLKSLFHKQWWDYSSMPYQLHGHICLRFSVYWWGLASACLFGLHPLMELLYRISESLWELLFPVALLYFIADVVWTCWTRRLGDKRVGLGEGQI
ncbi:putative ABC transporter permease [Paenibacillus sp. sgz500958]|uniref:putative ABC transporter permease n=1 Tax=Paenibacillus sp. sgz500958 TaxID=3242475 RepID=UPI0036D2E738